MNKNNEIITKKLDNVSRCIAELARRGLSILDISVSDRKPRITIQGYNDTPGGLKGGWCVRITEAGKRWETYATEVNGCQVQWRVSA